MAHLLPVRLSAIILNVTVIRENAWNRDTTLPESSLRAADANVEDKDDPIKIV
jgi:hypothetical protein